MTTKEHPELGKLWMPERSLSLPQMPVKKKPTNLVVATVRRPEWSIQGVIKLPDIHNPQSPRDDVRRALLPYIKKLNPALFSSSVIWASITHNERVTDGADHNVNRMFGTVGASNGVGSVVAVADSVLSKAAGDASLGTASPNVTTNEFTTIGLSRATGTVQNYSAPGALDGTFSVDVYNSFAVTGGGTAEGSGLFDQVTVSGSFLLCEDNFASNAVVVNGDTLNITWTWTH
jgi:hypothetical protein